MLRYLPVLSYKDPSNINAFQTILNNLKNRYLWKSHCQNLSLKIKAGFIKVRSNRQTSQKVQLSVKGQYQKIKKPFVTYSQSVTPTFFSQKSLKTQGIQYLINIFGQSSFNKTRQQKLDQCLNIFKFMDQRQFYPVLNKHPIDKEKLCLYAQKIDKIIQYEEQQGMVNQILDHLIDRQKMTLDEQIIIHNIFVFWGALMAQSILSMKKKLKKRTLYRFMQRWSRLVYLVRPTNAYIFLHCNILCKIKDIYGEHWLNQHISPIKYLLSNLTNLKVTVRQSRLMLSYLSKLYIYALNIENFSQIFAFLLKEAVKNDLTNYTTRHRQFYHSVCKLGIYNDQIIELSKASFYYICTPQKALIQIHSFVCLLEFKHITRDNIQKHDLKILQDLYKIIIEYDRAYYYFQFLLKYMYRVGIWCQKFWFHFFQFLEQGQNYTKLYYYDLYVIWTLFRIDSDIIPQTIIKRGYQSFDKITKMHGLRFQNINVNDVYQKTFKNIQSYGKKTESFFANSLRLTGKGKIQTQAMIQFINVDILVNDKLIIQINSPGHYIRKINSEKMQNKLEVTKNLKTSFRERVLTKLGYQIINIDVVDNCEANFEIINSIYKRIESKNKH